MSAEPIAGCGGYSCLLALLLFFVVCVVCISLLPLDVGIAKCNAAAVVVLLRAQSRVVIRGTFACGYAILLSIYVLFTTPLSPCPVASSPSSRHPYAARHDVDIARMHVS